MLKAITRSAQSVDQKLAVINQERQGNSQNELSVANYFDHYATDADTQVSVIEKDFENARDELVPSVSVDELRHYERVRQAFEGTTNKTSTNGTVSDAPDPNRSRGAEQSRPTDQPGNTARPKLTDFVKRVSENKDRQLLSNGNKRSQTSGDQSTGGATSDGDDDDYVVKTDRLSLNNTLGRPPSSKEKGKGKARAMPVVDGYGAGAEGEDLYD